MPVSFRPNALNELPPVTRGLLIASFLGWVLEIAFRGPLNEYFGLVPFQVMTSAWYWQLFTYIFIHASFWHFFFNAFMLWTLGGGLEPELGSRQFLFYFFFCGVVAGICTVLAGPGSARAVIGASGAIYGLLYAYAAVYPGQIIYVYFLFPMTVRQFVFLMACLALVMSFATPNSTVANFTHLSGLAAGWAYFMARRMVNSGGSQDIIARLAELWIRLFRTEQKQPDPSSWREVREYERARVDAILEKISIKGEASLTPSERRELDEYARHRGGKA